MVCEATVILTSTSSIDHMRHPGHPGHLFHLVIEVIKVIKSHLVIIPLFSMLRLTNKQTDRQQH